MGRTKRLRACMECQHEIMTDSTCHSFRCADCHQRMNECGNNRCRRCNKLIPRQKQFCPEHLAVTNPGKLFGSLRDTRSEDRVPVNSHAGIALKAYALEPDADAERRRRVEVYAQQVEEFQRVDFDDPRLRQRVEPQDPVKQFLEAIRGK